MKAKGADEVKNKPTPRNGLAWGAFNALRGSRQIGFGGVSPIPFSEIMAYCDHAGIDCQIQRERLVRFVQALDYTERVEHGPNT